MKKSCLCFLAIVTSIVLGIWGMFAYYNHYYIERFRLEHSNLERRSSVIDDLYGRTLEEKGQSYFVNSDFLYTYGKVGFIIINRRNGNIKVFQDKIVDNLIVDNLIEKNILIIRHKFVRKKAYLSHI